MLIAVLGVYAGHLGRRALGAAGRPPRRRLQRPSSNRRFTHAGYATALGGHFENDPVLGIVDAPRACTGPLLTVARDYVGVLAATILFIATNAGLIGISRLSWSLAEHRQLPQHLLAAAPALPHAVVHDRVLLGARGAADPATANTDAARQPLLVRRDAVVHDRARRRSSRCASRTPTASAPTGCPWNVRIRGAVIPLTAVLGGIGTFAAWCAVVAAARRGAHVGIPWMVVGMVGYFVYRRRQGLDPRSVLPDRAPGAPARLRGARLPHGARADLRRRRLSRARCAAPPS